uniref:C2H2-type domain-containing protein n=1 Tax=Meloidogyne incognita TaxID=6306 RepID=A0A914LGL4_MELIC
MEQQQQNNIKINSRKQRNDAIPVELLSDVFKSSNVSLKEFKTSSRHLWKEIYEPLSLPSSIKSIDEFKKKVKQVIIFKKMEEGGLIKYWHKVAKNILTSSGIVYSLVGESFRKMKLINMTEQNQLGQRAQDSVDELIEAGGVANFFKTLMDEKEQPLIHKMLTHIESQNSTNRQLIELATKQLELATKQQRTNEAMIEEVRTYLQLPAYKETSVKKTLTKSKSNPAKLSYNEFKCEDCGVKFATKKGYDQHLGTKKHKKAEEAKTRQREVEEGEQKIKGGEEPELEEFDASAPSSSKKSAR